MFLTAEKLQEHSYGIQLSYFDHQNKNYPSMENNTLQR